MGLGLTLVARTSAAPSQLLGQIEARARAFALSAGEPLASWYRGGATDEEAHIGLFPCEEDVEFSVDGGQVVCSAKTSSAGPGYHAYVVRLLDELRERLDLRWSSASSDDGDETGYFEARDYAALQQAMVQWLQGLSRMLLREDFADDGGVLLGFSVNAPRPTSTAFALSTLGEWPRSYFQQLAAADDDEAFQLASRFFVWWDDGITRENLHAFALGRAWLDVRWVGFERHDDSEAWNLHQSVLQAFERGTPRAGMPPAAAEIEELRQLVTHPDPARAPAKTGIGYRRRPHIYALPGQWSVTAPGHFECEYEESGCTVLYFHDRTIRISSFSFDGDPPQTPAQSLECIQDAPANSAPLDLPAHLAGYASASYSEEESCNLLEAHIGKTNGLCIASIYYEDPADEAWARGVAASIACPKLEGEA